ncbi:hypothetical protein Kazakh3173_11220 [Helicobacter pylori]
MEKTETTIFVDWENLLTDLKAIQETDERFKESHFNFNNPEQLLALIRSFLEPEEELKRIYFYASEPFTEAEPRITGKDKEDLEKFKKDYPEHYEKKVEMSGIIQEFNGNIAQQNQVKLRVGRVMFEFIDKLEDIEVHNGLKTKIPIPCLKLRQKQIDTLLAHGYYRAILHQTTRVYFTVQQGYRFCACVRSRLGERL